VESEESSTFEREILGKCLILTILLIDVILRGFVGSLCGRALFNNNNKSINLILKKTSINLTKKIRQKATVDCNP
jgi:ABC-type sugar transport system permease subunit